MTDTCGIEYTTIHDFRPSHRPVPIALSQQREITADAWAIVDAIVERRDSYQDDAEYWDALRLAEVNALAAQNLLHEVKRHYTFMGVPHPYLSSSPLSTTDSIAEDL